MIKFNNFQVKLSTSGNQITASIGSKTLHAHNRFSMIRHSRINILKMTNFQEHNCALITADGH